MSTEWKSIDKHIPGQDPYISWLLGPGGPYDIGLTDQKLLFPVILRLHRITAREFVEAIGLPPADGKPPPTVQVPSFYLDPPPFIGKPTIITAIVSMDFFDFLASRDDLHRRVIPTDLGPPLAPGTFCADPAIEQPVSLTGKPEDDTVVVGVIDDGIAFANARFRTKDGKTRVEYVWLQDGLCVCTDSPVLYGREYRKKQIDELLKACTTDGFLNEDKFYHATGLIDFGRTGRKTAAQRVAHGTHVMDLACGFDPIDNRVDRPIVCVQLPTETTADTSGTKLTPRVLDGIWYILDRADSIAKQRKSGPLPVVINFSYGIIAGPHDGTSALEDAIDKIVKSRNQSSPKAQLQVVLPSGNNHLTRTHGKLTFPRKGAVKELRWRVQPDDRTSSFLEIWLPYRENPTAASRIEVTVTPPGGPQSQRLREVTNPKVGDKGWAWKSNGHQLCWLLYTYPQAPTERGRFFIALIPTAFHDPPTQLAPSGVWLVKVKNLTLGETDLVEAWIQRGDAAPGYPIRGRQSYFDEKCYERFDGAGREIEEDDPDCHIERAGTINALATGREAIVIGGFLRKEGLPAEESSGGPITPTRSNKKAHRDGPDAMTVCDDSLVHRGVLAAGSRSGSVVAMSGTSVAAPQIARWIACKLAKKEPSDREEVKKRAKHDEARRPRPKPGPPSKERGGWGRIRLDPVYPRQRYW